MRKIAAVLCSMLLVASVCAAPQTKKSVPVQKKQRVSELRFIPPALLPTPVQGYFACGKITHMGITTYYVRSTNAAILVGQAEPKDITNLATCIKKDHNKTLTMQLPEITALEEDYEGIICSGQKAWGVAQTFTITTSTVELLDPERIRTCMIRLFEKSEKLQREERGKEKMQQEKESPHENKS